MVLRYRGRKSLARAWAHQLASVTIRYEGKPKVRAYSKAFSISPDRISALKAGVSIYIEGDSIYHSQLDFNYIEESHEKENDAEQK